MNSRKCTIIEEMDAVYFDQGMVGAVRVLRARFSTGGEANMHTWENLNDVIEDHEKPRFASQSDSQNENAPSPPNCEIGEGVTAVSPEDFPAVAASSLDEQGKILAHLGLRSGDVWTVLVPSQIEIVRNCRIYLAESLRFDPAWKDAIAALPVSQIEFVSVEDGE